MAIAKRQSVEFCPSCQGGSSIIESHGLRSGLLRRKRRCLASVSCGSWFTYELTTRNLSDLRRALRLALHHAQTAERSIAVFLEEINSDKRSLKDLERRGSVRSHSPIRANNGTKSSGNAVPASPHHAGQMPVNTTKDERNG